MRLLVLLALVLTSALGTGCYASMEPSVEMQYPEGGPKLWVVCVMPLSWQEHGREKHPSTLIGTRFDKPGVSQGVLIVGNFEPGKRKFIDLKTLSLADAEKLWGELKPTDDPESKILELTRPMGLYPDYHVDFRFKNDRLLSYRVRHHDFQDPTWTELNN